MAQLGPLITLTVNDLENRLGDTGLSAFVHDTEYRFLRETMEIADRIAWDPDIRAVFISGPTSSGKTTFTQRLQSALALMGRPAHTLSLDDYYGERMPRVDDRGRPDYETIDMLDTDLMADQIQMLLDGYEVHVPHFDMRSGRRVYTSDRVRKLPEDGLLLVEGLHGLSPDVAGSLDRNAAFGVFIMPYGALMDGRRLIEPREIRVFRRISRDSHHRGAPALSTIDYWPMIQLSEQVYFEQYLKTADVYINSVIPYEFGVIPHQAADCIRESLRDYEEGRLTDSVFLKQGGFADIDATMERARSYLEIADRVPRLEASRVPSVSILNEFIR